MKREDSGRRGVRNHPAPGRAPTRQDGLRPAARGTVTGHRPAPARWHLPDGVGCPYTEMPFVTGSQRTRPKTSTSLEMTGGKTLSAKGLAGPQRSR